MKKRTLIRALLSVGLLAYLVVAISRADAMRADARCTGMVIDIVDSSSCRFVTHDGIDQELNGLCANAPLMRLRDINTDAIERKLDLIDDIEESVCTRLSDGTVLLRVIPMRPVVRVFNPDGTSYYVNKAGKKMKASLRYRMDVPVVVNEGDTSFNAVSLLPLLNIIQGDSLWNSLVTAVKVTRGGDVILIPSIRGHVINLGDTTIVNDKLDRMLTMYRKVLPVKGWNTYDTLSVKWRGQVVATHRNKHLTDDSLAGEEIIDEEGDDEGTMMADSTAVKHTNKLS